MKTDHAITSKAGDKGVLTSFFFTNFLEHYQAKDILVVFKTFGRLGSLLFLQEETRLARGLGFYVFRQLRSRPA